MAYVELNRIFVDAPEEVSEDEFEAFFDADLLSERGKAWPDVLKNRFVLILGTAGVGKTTEMIHQAEALNAAGTPAFFTRLEDIAKNGFEKSLTVADGQRYDAWLRSSDQAVFFLDSVDEAKIDAYRDFNRALNTFTSAVNAAAARVNVVLSCRPSDWMHITDLAFVKAALAPLASAMLSGGGDDDEKELKAISGDEAAADVEEEEAPTDTKQDIELSLIQLRPLDRAQVLTLATAFGLNDADVFVAALEVKENLFIAATPRDVEWLTVYWRRHKSIGLLWDMMAASVEEKLREQNGTHYYKDTLPPDLSRSGTERIAGANALCREPNIKLFDPELTTNPVKGLDIEKLLSDFPTKLLGNLLRRPIYNERLAGRVRIDPKQTRSFLAGSWLLRLIADGAPRAKIRALLMGSVFGKEKAVASMIEIAAWVACQDSAIRAHLIRVAPEAILFMGDAAKVPVEERIEAIKSFARNYAGTHKFQWIVSDVDYARASHPAMDATVTELLRDRSISFDASKLLLRFTAVGRLSHAATTALAMALDGSMERSIRVWAIDAVANAGSDAERATLRDALMGGQFEEDSLIERATRELFPRTLSLDDLDAIIDLFTVENPEAVGGPSHTIAYYWTANCPADQLPAMLAILVTRVLTPPLKGQDGFEPLLSEKYFWLIDAVGKCARRVIDARAARNDSDIAVLNQALALIEKAKDQGGFHLFGADEIESALRGNEGARRSYVAAKILTSTRRRHFLSGRSLSRPFPGDDAWLLAQSITAPTEQARKRLLEGAVEVSAMTGRSAELKQHLESAVNAAPFTDDEKRNLISYLNPTAAEPDREWEDEQRQRRAAEAKIRAESARRIEAKIAQLRDGSDYSAIHYLVREMRNAASASNSTWAQTNIAVIERLYGKDLAAALRAGLTVSWRRYTPGLKSTLEKKSSVEFGVLTGLTALALEYRDGFDFKTLSDADAAIATHYALREMNQFPRWFAIVAASKPNIVAPILINEVKAQLAAPPDQRGDIINLREIRRNDALTKLVGQELVRELPHLTTLNAESLNEVLDIISAAGVTDPDHARNAAAKTEAAWTSDLTTALVWLQEWLKSEPSAAVDYLERKLTESPDQAIAVMMRFLLQIDDDLKNAQTGAYLRKVDLLKRLIPLAYKYVPPETDPEHEGVYEVTADDDAREARGRLAGLMETIDGMDAHNALLELIAHPDVASIKDAFERAVDRHASRAVESDAWELADVRDFATFYNRDPVNAYELFRLVHERLEDIKDNIETDDFGDKGLLDAGSDETRLQRYFAGRVDRESHQRYSVVREPEVANHKKPDFRVYHPKAGMATVEVKPLDATRYSFESLKDTISTQLVGQYMKAARSRHGILLLCLLKKDRTWDIAGKKSSFAELLAALRTEAARVQAANTNVERLAIVGVDMSAWEAPKRAKAKKATPKVKKAKAKSKAAKKKVPAKKTAKRKAAATKRKTAKKSKMR